MAVKLNISENQENVPLKVSSKSVVRTVTPDDGSPYYVGARAYVTQTAGGATVTVTDKDGTTTAVISNGTDGIDGIDGQDGTDGYSPSATVSKVGTTTTITITDKDGTTTAEVYDGSSGASAFIAEYGVTSYADVKDAYDNDAIIICVYNDNGNVWVLQFAYYDSNEEYFAFVEPKSDGALYTILSNEVGWDDGVFAYASTDLATSLRDGLMSALDYQKLSGIASGAEPNVQSDWNQSVNTADDFIKNKPAIHNVPSGGSSGQVLSKASGTDYDLAWVNQGGGGGGAVDSVNGKTGVVVLDADDVGALPDDTVIPTVPTDVSAFTNDAGYLTSFTEIDPTVPSWAKEASKPSYSASEISGLIDLFYPVGSYYETSDSLFDPNITWDGTWSLETIIGADVVERGSDYIRYSNGLQICWIAENVNVAINSSYGNLYQGTYSWQFAKAFLSGTNPAVGVGGGQWETGGSWASMAGLASATSATIRCFDVTSRVSGSTKISAIAIGQWKAWENSTIYRWHRTA